MSEEQAFLDEITRNPDDDAPRLVYADWLEERGDIRGEYLRLGVKLAGLARPGSKGRKPAAVPDSPEARELRHGRLDAVRIVDDLTEHLAATADPEGEPACRGVCQHRVRHAGRA